jgi:hypothetical protein
MPKLSGNGKDGDRIRWRREQSDRWLSARREVYAGYLNALHEANQGMRAVSLGDFSAEFEVFSDCLHDLRNAIRHDLGVAVLRTQVPI